MKIAVLLLLPMVSVASFAQEFNPCPGAAGIERTECLERSLKKGAGILKEALSQAYKIIDAADYIPPQERQKWRKAVERSQQQWAAQTKTECDEVEPYNWWGAVSGSGLTSGILECQILKTAFRINEISNRFGLNKK